MNFSLIHGVYGGPEENWLPWLKQELESRGHKAFTPAFPTPEGHSLENWIKVFEDFQKDAQGAVFVAHSMAPAFVLHLIEKGLSPKHCFFVAPFYGKTGDAEIDELNSSFMGAIDWEKVASASHYTCYYSDNDPYVPVETALDFAKRLNAEAKMVKGAGHFSAATGYTEFPMLLEDLLK
ncbi:MAG: alpha/beta hydrolase [Candidatus Diapherotrites archaeon]|nr:alpha/beta hydrolase [Candidatus Diapherotrites archaeon]